MALYSTAAEYKKAAKNQIASGKGLSISALTSIGKTGQEGTLAFEELLTGGKTAQTVDVGADTSAVSSVASGLTSLTEQAKKNVGTLKNPWGLSSYSKKLLTEKTRLSNILAGLA